MPHDPTVIPIMRGRLVVVAERYLTARVLVTSGVRALGYPARSCPTGSDTLRFLSLHPAGVQCLLADLGLPDMDGGELVERAVDIVPGLRVVLMAAPDHPAVEVLPGYRDIPCLTKPVRYEALAETLEQLLGPPESEPVHPLTVLRPRPRRRPSGQHQG
jgi:CheY-like chemotaxis protein